MIMDGEKDKSGPSGVFKKPGIPPSLRRRARSPTARAGINFSVGKLQRVLDNITPPGIHGSVPSAVYFGAVLQYLTAEVMTVSGDLAREYGQSRITVRHVQFAIREDPDMDRMVRDILEAKGRYVSSDSDDDDFEYPASGPANYGPGNVQRGGGYSH